MRFLLFFAFFFHSACGSFDDPTIVYDSRFLGAIAEPPEILIPVDTGELDPSELPEIEVCALFADPGESRELSYSMVACPPSENGRCDDDSPQARLGSGQLLDPEESNQPIRLCETLGPSPDLITVIEESVSLDSLAGFGAVDIQVEISVWPRGNREQTIFASKQVRFGAELPAERVANENPSLSGIEVTQDELGAAGLSFDLPIGRCSDFVPPQVPIGMTIDLLPIESEGSRQEYLVPTLDGGSREFTENLRYRFYSTAGNWSNATSGGARDISGNIPTLDSSWTAPDDVELVGNGLDVALWVIQRDERGGQSWFPSCVRVVP